jgi:small-conductance mechanosensitive channel
MKDYILDMTDSGLIKSYFYVFASFIAGYLGITGFSHHLVFLLAISMSVDTIAAWLMWWRIDPNKLTSQAAKEGIFKKIVMFLIILILIIAFKVVGINPGPMLNVTFTVLILAECFSALNNLHNALKKEIVQEFDTVSYLIKWTKERVYELLSKALGNKNNK